MEVVKVPMFISNIHTTNVAAPPPVSSQLILILPGRLNAKSSLTVKCSRPFQKMQASDCSLYLLIAGALSMKSRGRKPAPPNQVRQQDSNISRVGVTDPEKELLDQHLIIRARSIDRRACPANRRVHSV
ncbi:hypothetical protein Nepgr_000653 [Nepenthes gracilis]|uniref:Uncharacterized protein n=1 Tax=Nepenthes gracilis TaxID=150966 RepID=A0AAD3P388_NEPGR|nr:hypothetical protein Nepgr_000653 [Nepenthes gracilis]